MESGRMAASFDAKNRKYGQFRSNATISPRLIDVSECNTRKYENIYSDISIQLSKLDGSRLRIGKICAEGLFVFTQLRFV